MATLSMTQAERETFLADLHVGVISIDEPNRAPLTVPIWYDYEPAVGIWVITGSESRKGRLLAQAMRYSLCAQVETGLYKYVSVEGPIVEIRAAETERDSRPMAHRYFGVEFGDQYVAGSEESDNQVYVMRPERWLTVDYANAGR